MVEKLKALGVPLGPLCARLKQGDTVTTTDGREVTSAEVVGPPRPGRKLVVLGDTADSSEIAPLADGADVIVHEATNEGSHEEKTRSYGHSTPGKSVCCVGCMITQPLHLILNISQNHVGI